MLIEFLCEWCCVSVRSLIAELSINSHCERGSLFDGLFWCLMRYCRLLGAVGDALIRAVDVLQTRSLVLLE